MARAGSANSSPGDQHGAGAPVGRARPPRAAGKASAPAAKQPATRAAKPAARKAPATKAPAAKEPSGKTPAKKQPAKKAPAEKDPAKKQPARKQPAEKAPAEKAPAEKAPAARAPARKDQAKKQPAGKQPAGKQPAGKQPAGKQPAKKAPAAKGAASKQRPRGDRAPAPPLGKEAASTRKGPRRATVICPLSGFEVKPDKPGLAPRTIERLRVKLLDERQRHLEQAELLAAEAQQLALDREEGDTQFDEEGGEGDTISVERERDLVLSASARQIVEEIDRALERIKNRTYGLCVPAGRRISLERLEALPYAETCVDCKARAERRR